MAVQVKMSIVEYNGASEKPFEGAQNINFGSFDVAEMNILDHPIRSGENSVEKFIKLKFTGKFNRISNIKVWKEFGEYNTGEVLKTNASEDKYKGDAPFQTPTSETSNWAVFPMPNSEPAKANVGINGKVDGMIVSDEEKDKTAYSDFIILQMQTTEHTPAGKMEKKGLRFTYEVV